jgi:hypothetical protein
VADALTDTQVLFRDFRGRCRSGGGVDDTIDILTSSSHKVYGSPNVPGVLALAAHEEALTEYALEQSSHRAARRDGAGDGPRALRGADRRLMPKRTGKRAVASEAFEITDAIPA